MVDIKLTHRVTFMPVVSADGETGPPLLVFKGNSVPYRQVLRDGKVHVEKYASHLPHGSVDAVLEQGGDVDSANFYE